MDDNDELGARLAIGCSRFARTAAWVSGEAGNAGLSMRVLSRLSMNGPLRIGALARLESATQPAVTAAVKSLATAGLIARRADPDDARATLVELTASGAQVLEDYHRAIAATIRPALEQLDPGEREQIVGALAVLERLTTQWQQLP